MKNLGYYNGKYGEIEEMQMQGKPKTVGKDVTVAEIMEIVRSDRPYYERSGGGLTLSGGECTAQPDFAYALLSAAKAEGIHTAIETTANTPRDVLSRLVSVVDTFLMDVLAEQFPNFE